MDSVEEGQWIFPAAWNREIKTLFFQHHTLLISELSWQRTAWNNGAWKGRWRKSEGSASLVPYIPFDVLKKIHPHHKLQNKTKRHLPIFIGQLLPCLDRPSVSFPVVIAWAIIKRSGWTDPLFWNWNATNWQEGKKKKEDSKRILIGHVPGISNEDPW